MNEDLVSLIKQRCAQIQARVAAAAFHSGRDPAAVRLVVVSKAQPLAVVKAAVAAGVRILGENYAEEAVAKIAVLGESGVEWHMIGHVQSRKADLVARYFAMLHSLDSLKLASRLSRFLAGNQRHLPVLLEFNLSGEASKFGWHAWDEAHWPGLLPEIEQILALPWLEIRGLMTMPPYFEQAEASRPYFQCLRRLQDFLSRHLPRVDWSGLSMGTSLDFEVAVQEGATYVRIGQAILGSRPA